MVQDVRKLIELYLLRDREWVAPQARVIHHAEPRSISEGSRMRGYARIANFIPSPKQATRLVAWPCEAVCTGGLEGRLAARDLAELGPCASREKV